MQLRTQGRIAKSVSAQSATDQSTMISNLYDSNLNLRKEVDSLHAQLAEHNASFGQSDLTAMIRELNKLRIANGLSEVSGPGVLMTVSADLRPDELEDLINELRNAGAEAIAVNGQRVVARTAVAEAGSSVAINGIRIGKPYILLAIGQPETLERALVRKGGLVTYLQNTYPDATVAVLKRTKMTLPVYPAGYEWQYAVPAK